MSFIHDIQQKPEETRRQIFAVIMVFVGVGVASLGIHTLRGRIASISTEKIKKDNTPFIVIGEVAKKSVAQVGSVVEDASAGWGDMAKDVDVWRANQ